MLEKKRFWENKYIALLLITGAVYFFLRYISPLLTPAIIAGLFLTLCYPTFDDIQKKTRIKKQYLASGILLLILGVMIVLVWWAGSYLLREIPIWIEGIDCAQEGVHVFLEESCHNMGEFLGVNMDKVGQALVEQVDIFVENFQIQVLPKMIGESWTYIKQFLSIIAVLAVTMIATVLFAKDYDAILSWVGAHKESRMALEVVLKVIRYIATFVKAQLLIMLSIATVCVIGLLISGVESAVAFGLLAGFLDALPFIGTGIVLMPLAVWQLFLGYPWKAAACVLLYVICALIREFMEPKLIGKKVGVYPIAILISIYAGLKLFGIWGIVKGPIGLVLIQKCYEVCSRA